MKLSKKSDTKEVVLPSEYPISGVGTAAQLFLKW